MAAPTDIINNMEGTRATFTPGGGSAIEFSEVSLQAGGGFEFGIGEDVTGGEDYDDTTHVATAQMSGSRKKTFKPFTIEMRLSMTQEAALEAAGGVAGRGAILFTFVDGSTKTNSSVDLIDYDIASDTVNAAGSVAATATFQPSGAAEWVNVAAT